MFVEFSLKNYLSIKEEVTLSMVAANSVKEHEDNTENNTNNVFKDIGDKNKYLKSVVLYGANGSGKSNLLTGIRFYKKFILSSSNDRQSTDEIDIIPFLFNSTTEGAPSSFEMVFIIDKTQYRYGFEVTKKSVVSEWLFGADLSASTKESVYFTRVDNNIKVSAKKFKEGKGLEDHTRSNALFLSTVAQLNGATANVIQKWFSSNLHVISGLDDSTTPYTIERFQKDEKFKAKLLSFIKLIGLGIEDIKVEEAAIDNISKLFPESERTNKIAVLLQELQNEINHRNQKADDAKKVSINFLHRKYDDLNNIIDLAELDLGLESRGTQKLFGLLGPWFNVLENGEILIVDELDSRLHTKLTIELLRLFHSALNSKNAQLVFASHDTNLLRKDMFRRDQVWFTEKNEMGATDLYSLVEYKVNQAMSVRNDASFEKDYLMGKYGAIPYFGNIDNFINDFVDEKQ